MLQFLAYLLCVLQGLVGGGLEGLAARVGAANGILELDVDVQLLGVEVVELVCLCGDSLQDCYDEIGGGLGGGSLEGVFRHAEMG